MTRLLLIICSVFIAVQSYALTFKTTSNNDGNGRAGAAPVTLLKDLVTNKVKAEQLSDDDLCLSLTSLDLISTFNEMKARGLDCLAISKQQPGYESPNSEDSFRFLRAYQKNYDVVVPKFDLTRAGSLFGSATQTLQTFEALNPNFRKIIVDNDKQSEFCLDWFPQVATIVENQSKNLDDTISWAQDSLRDGFVICQNSWNRLIYRALFDKDVRDILQNAIEGWVQSDTPNRDLSYEGSGFFTYSIQLNKILIAIELLHENFDWDSAQYQKTGNWMQARVMELFPAASKSQWDRLAKKCATKINRQAGPMEVCQNGGALQAQITLRAGIFAKNQELVEMSYIAFHRYMSGIRKDGSNVADSARGCVAADYNIWASQFMSDYVYLWSQGGAPLWEHRSFDRGSPKDAVEYSLSLFDDFEAINKYTISGSWDGCGQDGKDRTQQAGTMYEGKYYKVSFSPYFLEYDTPTLGELLEPANYERRDSFAYTKQSGIAYEASLLMQNPKLRTEIQAAKQRRIDDVTAKAANLSDGMFTFEDGYFVPTSQTMVVSKRGDVKAYVVGQTSAVAGMNGPLKIKGNNAVAPTGRHADLIPASGNFNLFHDIVVFDSRTTRMIGFYNAETGHDFSKPLVTHQQQLAKKCDFGSFHENMIIVTRTMDIDMIKRQKCIADYFAKSGDTAAIKAYFTFYAAAHQLDKLATEITAGEG